MLTAYRPLWTRKVSRPKNTEISPDAEVSQPAGIQGCPGRGSSKLGFTSRLEDGPDVAADPPGASTSRLESASRGARRNRSIGILSGRDSMAVVAAGG